MFNKERMGLSSRITPCSVCRRECNNLLQMPENVHLLFPPGVTMRLAATCYSEQQPQQQQQPAASLHTPHPIRVPDFFSSLSLSEIPSYVLQYPENPRLFEYDHECRELNAFLPSLSPTLYKREAKKMFCFPPFVVTWPTGSSILRS